MKVYIGWDWREDLAWQVCRHSLLARSSIPLEIEPISSRHPWYTRQFVWKGNQRYDALDGRPFSTDFSFARFLVPLIAQGQGWVLFCDCDFLFRVDVAELLKLADENKAVMLVPHQFSPSDTKKMDGVEQTRYPRKNWSSLVLWNTDHRANYLIDPLRGLDAQKVNSYSGQWLHGFQWLHINEIGFLPEEWNHLVGHSTCENPKALHFTSGGPWFKEYEDVPYAGEWRAARDEMFYQQQFPPALNTFDAERAHG